LCLLRKVEVTMTDGAGDYPHVVLEDIAYRSGERGAKGRGVRSVGLLDEAGRVDLVVQNHHGAQAPGCIAGRDPHGGEEVCRALCAREGGVAHGTCHDYGRIPFHQQVQDEGCLFYGVGTLGHHDARRAGIDAAFDLRGQLDQIFQHQL
jgi:hypothetical protein